MFMDIKAMTEIKKKQLSGQSKDMAFLISAGTLTTAPGGHGTQYGLPDRGQIKAGFKADLLLVKGDPTKDILNSRNIFLVWREGIKVDRSQYLASVDKAKKDIENQKEAPPPENSESGWISDFEGKNISSNFGTGWSISTDSMIGGKSDAEYRWENEGAQGSKGSLFITGC